jgi:peptidoglycan/LPS O-acetylase OafA/YrhL
MNFIADPQWTLGHLWSLAVEEQFYLLWPAVLALSGRRRAMQIAVAVVCVSPLIRFACMYIPAANPLIGTAFPTIADPLAVGCLLAGMRTRLDGRQSYLTFLTSRWFWFVPPAILVLNVLPGTKLNMLVTQSLLNICIAVVIDRFVRFPEGRVGAVLNWPPVRAAGVLSYSLYLWQQPFLNPLSRQVFTAFPQNLILAVICGYASYRLVEKPFLEWRVTLERRWKTPDVRSAVAAAAGGAPGT